MQLVKEAAALMAKLLRGKVIRDKPLNEKRSHRQKKPSLFFKRSVPG